MAVLLWLGGSALPSLLPLVPLPPSLQPAQKPRQEAPAKQAPPRSQGTSPSDASVFEAIGELQGFGVRIVSPAPDDEVAGRVRVRAEVAADRPAAVAAVDFFVDGRLLFSDAEAPYELLWNSGRAAHHVIEVRAYGPGRQMVSDTLNTRHVAPAASGAYSARVERVELHVRIEGEEPRTGPLDPSMFEVFEDGILQPVVAVERVAELPLAVGILVDHSGSMLERLETSLDAAGAFVEGLLTHAQDKAFVLGFADVPVVFQEFTNDTDRLAQSIELIDAGRYTALYDAIVAASLRFTGSGGRRAVILLTDGADQGSEHRFREAIAAAQRADVALYPVGVDLSPRFARERWVLSELAEETGGRLFFLGQRSDPAEIYDAIARDLRSQYRVSYAPLIPGGQGEWREVEVRLGGEARDDRKVRSRPGYFAR
jgi:Ca-activated chloride channel family protein